MDDATLRLLQDVARHGSFAAAARATAQDPSAVSRAVAAAEARLGARLFHRSTRRLAPTEAGARYLAAVAAPLAALEAAAEALRDDRARVAGRVRVAASVAYGTAVIAPRLPDLAARHPDLAVDLVLDDDRRDLAGDRIDVAVRLGPAVAGARRLHGVAYRLVAAPGWAAAHPDRAPDALAAHALVHDRVAPVWRRRVRGAERMLPLAPRFAFGTPTAQRAACVAGLGPALLADWLVARDLAAGRLVDLGAGADWALTGFDAAAWALRPSGAQVPRRVRVVTDWLGESSG